MLEKRWDVFVHIQRNYLIKRFFTYSVMQSDGNSLKINTFQEAITSEIMI